MTSIDDRQKAVIHRVIERIDLRIQRLEQVKLRLQSKLDKMEEPK